jgi:hypothetical protein
MAARPFVVTPADYASTLDIVGEHVTVLASGESFYVVKGQMEFGIGAEAMTASPGTLVHLPAGTTHWFRFGAGGGEMISMTSRLGASKMFADVAREVSPVNPDLERLTEVGARHGLKVVV